MRYLSIVREGISIINNSWQLVFLHVISAFISFVCFFLIVGIPISIAFVIFGLDLTEILRSKDVIEVVRHSLNLLKKYFAMGLVVILSILIYFTVVVVLWLFTISGTVGTIAKIIRGELSKYAFKFFLSEGKRLFFPIFGYSAIIGIFFLFLAFLLGLLGGSISSIIEIAKSREAVLALFLGIFFSAIIFITGLLLIVFVLSLTVYGIAHVAFEKKGPIKTFKQTIKYIYVQPASVIFYSFLLVCSLIAIFIIILFGTPIVLIPILGPILSPLYQIMTVFLQAYINLVVFASAFLYFYEYITQQKENNKLRLEGEHALDVSQN
ncbi:MAG: hypothetical protein N2511_04505 [Thermodesulfovibrionales bacterium]|nr:hypothetical protein [Thermodesulfovibrionales bacterium]